MLASVLGAGLAVLLRVYTVAGRVRAWLRSSPGRAATGKKAAYDTGQTAKINGTPRLSTRKVRGSPSFQ